MQSSFCLYFMHHENGNAGLNKRETAHEVRGPRTARTGAERRHRTFEPCQGSKKRTIPIWYRSFFKRETGIEPVKQFSI